MQLTIKEIDGQGRVVLPKEWRQRLETRKVVVIVEQDMVKIIPEAQKLSSFFEKAKASSLAPDPFQDYHGSVAAASRR